MDWEEQIENPSFPDSSWQTQTDPYRPWQILTDWEEKIENSRVPDSCGHTIRDLEEQIENQVLKDPERPRRTLTDWEEELENPRVPDSSQGTLTDPDRTEGPQKTQMDPEGLQNVNLGNFEVCSLAD